MEVWAFILARAIFGITMAGAYVTCPLYTKEISSNSVRGMLGTLVSIIDGSRSRDDENHESFHDGWSSVDDDFYALPKKMH